MTLAEVILKRKTTRFSSVLPVLTQIYIDAHNWNPDDRIAETYDRKKAHVLKNILVGNIKNNNVKGKVVYSSRIEEDDSEPGHRYIVKEIDLENSDVDFKALIPFVIDDVSNVDAIPQALKNIVGLCDNIGKIETEPEISHTLGPRHEQKIDRLVCQAIAKTLWDIEPNMTLKQMKDHRAIQVYGNGKLYKDPKTLLGWLSEVDPRPEDKKRGPKKRNAEGEANVV